LGGDNGEYAEGFLAHSQVAVMVEGSGSSEGASRSAKVPGRSHALPYDRLCKVPR
jgi:hypothetical protein